MQQDECFDGYFADNPAEVLLRVRVNRASALLRRHDSHFQIVLFDDLEHPGAHVIADVTSEVRDSKSVYRVPTDVNAEELFNACFSAGSVIAVRPGDPAWGLLQKCEYLTWMVFESLASSSVAP
jgi:hypothetical protein